MSRFSAIPRRSRPLYRFDLASLFADPAAFEAAAAAAEDLAKRMGAFRGRVGASGASLGEALRLHESLTAAMLRLHAYAGLRQSVDVHDTRPLARVERVEASVGAQAGFLAAEIAGLAPASLARLKRHRGVGRHAFFLDAVARDRGHTLAPAAERVLAAVVPRCTLWQGDLYFRLLARTDFGTIRTPEGRGLHGRCDYARAQVHPSTAVRRAAYRAYHAGFRRTRDLHAHLLLHLVGTRNEIARLRRFRDATEEAAFAGWLDPGFVESVFESLRRQTPLRRRWERLRARRVRGPRARGRLQPWDVRLPPAGLRAPRMTVEGAAAVIRDALAPLGDEYGLLLERLFDPSAGRIDMVPGKGRSPGAFSLSVHGGRSYVYLFAYQGLADDVATLAHEAGHAVHADLMSAAGVPLFHALLDPYYLTEAYAILNELLLYDHLAAKGGERERPYWRGCLVNTLFDVFRRAQNAALEWRLYRAADRGDVVGSDDLDELCRRLGEDLALDPAGTLALENTWMTVEHFSTSPLYYLNYVIAHLIATWVYARLRQEPAFAAAVLRLMRNGLDRPPDILLRDLLGVRLDGPELVATTFAVLEASLEGLARA